MIESLLLNLGQHDVLTDGERDVLGHIIGRERRFPAGEDLVVEGSRPGHSSLLIDGFAARYKLTAEGTRQITAIHVAGDFVDLHAFLLKTMDHGVVALSACHVAFADHAELKLVTERHPHLTRMLWLDTLVHGSIHRAWIVAMGRRSKASHLAHIICELYVRLQVVHRVSGWSFYLPLSQGEMADVLGLSLVHMNRVIQMLRREGLISWVNQIVTILDWERLKEVAEFDPTYLSLSVEPR
ncbi:cAMP-binding domain of CRP or a regulatory subunit of cAMP-dependent protein kinases [Xaviernesmea oryzae]|uniref:cAMP-binding domain of CRP or a regulatory subunit of cAMP-dependent protein kinases n=1 Tax=Xaviernesmea oryzae TaxID=464029 RepID=A0A1X7GGH8_9HYPH|nr:Crp/Fnr family transcriptional regulator [Xaviernesmea oryzae]SMF69340.1 cAMP-binding domain of CRP or a regulatory subunit of cAMP-dependent protein kinases [Xaviernesmea oryzae]